MEAGAAGLKAAAVPTSERAPEPAVRGWSRSALERQRFVGRLAAAVWLPVVVSLMRFGFRWRIRDAGRCRSEYAKLLEDGARSSSWPTT